MNSQDLSNLQEAYLEVYQLGEGENPLPYGRMMKKSDELASTDDKTKQKRAAKIYTAANAPKGPKIKVKEQVDLYDIILSHLLDEGYADTQEQAEAIMVNMSEDKRPIYGRGGAIRKTETPLQIYGKQATAKDKRTKHNIPKGGTTIDKRDPDELFSGDYDRGSGNAAKRRAAALTKPEAKKFPNRLTRSDKQGIKDSYEYHLDEKIATPPSWWNARKGLDAATRRRRRSRDFDTYGGENQEDLYGKERTISTSKGEGGITKNPKKLRKQKAMGEFREQVDLYDIILSHLLDEGYAETQEQAEVIMVNMSEDWRESITEAYKKLPLGKMMKKVQKRATREADTRAEIEYDPTFPTMKALKAAEKASRENKRSDTMINVADTHNEKQAKRKEDDNRREGGRKREAGRPRRNELQDNW
jgi:hypothetical protein